MYWKQPKDIHVVYEAISAVADKRISLIGKNKAKCFSTSGKKYYEIEYDPEADSIMSNDNMAYYVGEISYPMIAYFLVIKKISYNKDILKYFKNIKWKDINQKNKNDFMKSVREVLKNIGENDGDVKFIENEADKIFKEVLDLKLKQLGELKLPPKTY